LKRLVRDDRSARVVLSCVHHNIAVYSPHTAMDAVAGGVNDWLAAGVLAAPFDSAKWAQSAAAVAPAPASSTGAGAGVSVAAAGDDEWCAAARCVKPIRALKEVRLSLLGPHAHAFVSLSVMSDSITEARSMIVLAVGVVVVVVFVAVVSDRRRGMAMAALSSCRLPCR
jgi:hypothetical protein